MLISSFVPAVVHAQETGDVIFRIGDTSQDAAPLEISLEITSPTLDGLYLENRPVTIKISIRNVGEGPADIGASGTLTKFRDPNFEPMKFEFEQRATAPGDYQVEKSQESWKLGAIAYLS